jgi:hypothetical protein
MTTQFIANFTGYRIHPVDPDGLPNPPRLPPAGRAGSVLRGCDAAAPQAEAARAAVAGNGRIHGRTKMTPSRSHAQFEQA